MNLSPYQIALLSGGFILLGAFIGNWISHYFTDYRNRKERYKNTYNAFLESFLPSIQILIKESGTFTPDDFRNFITYYSVQETAMLRILVELNKRSIIKFKGKWNEYRNWQKQCNENYEMCVMTIEK